METKMASDSKMASDWYWPLTISLLRLAVIMLLLLINGVTVRRLLNRRKEKYKETQLSLVITWNSIIYLLLVWVPFTLGTLSHDLDDLSEQKIDSFDLENNLTIHNDGSISSRPRRRNTVVENLLKMEDFPVWEPDAVDKYYMEYADFFDDLHMTLYDYDENDPEFTTEYIDIVDGKVVLAPHKKISIKSLEADLRHLWKKKYIVTHNYLKESTAPPASETGESSVSPSYNYSAEDVDRMARHLIDLAKQEFEFPNDNESLDYLLKRFFDKDIVYKDNFYKSRGIFASKPKESSESPSSKKDSSTKSMSSDTGGSSAADEQSDMLTSLNTVGQDFMTSLCVYLLSVLAIIKICLRKTYVGNPFPWFIAYLGVPFFIPMFILYISRTLFGGCAEFAPHKPEYTSAGYFLYNLICDVKITLTYAIDVIVEWACIVVFVLATLPLLKRYVESYLPRNKNDRELETKVYSSLYASSHATESWARDVTLGIALAWTSLVKPSMVFILFYLYGEHWTNSVCWVAHVAIAIPVVFLPLSVFLSGYKDNRNPTDVSIFRELQRQLRLKDKRENTDIERNDNTDVKNHKDLEVKKSTKQDNEKIEIPCDEKNKTSDDRKEEQMQTQHPEDIEKGQEATDDHFKNIPEIEPTHTAGNMARENLKFYLGRDIFKFGMKPSEKSSDKQLILDTEWDETNASEA